MITQPIKQEKITQHSHLTRAVAKVLPEVMCFSCFALGTRAP